MLIHYILDFSLKILKTFFKEQFYVQLRKGTEVSHLLPTPTHA